MFFKTAKEAKIYCNIQTTRSGYKHKVVKCKKYLCPPKDSIEGYTVILK